MSELSNGQGRASSMERKRRQILSMSVMSFTFWQVFDILGGIKSLDSAKTLLVGLSMCAWAIWFFSLFKLYMFSKEMAKEPRVARVLSDERWTQNRLNSFALGFVAVMAAQAALILLSLIISLDAMLASRITILVGVIAFIAAFLFYDKE